MNSWLLGGSSITGDEDNNINNNNNVGVSDGVIDDFTEIKQTFNRQFRGVAYFLPPPPSPISQKYEINVKKGVFCENNGDKNVENGVFCENNDEKNVENGGFCENNGEKNIKNGIFCESNDEKNVEKGVFCENNGEKNIQNGAFCEKNIQNGAFCEENIQNGAFCGKNIQNSAFCENNGEKNVEKGVFCENNEDYNGKERGYFVNNENYEDEYDNSENGDNEAIGITEEVLNFAMNIAHHPETWLDFPLDEEKDDDDEQNALDFDMSDEQQKHVMAIQCLAPRLAALRIELCPAHMSDGYFWKVYFVLLHSRLNKQDAELLSTPQTLAARGIWIKELQKRNKREMDRSPRGSSDAIDSPSKWLESFGHGRSVLGRTSYSLSTEPETVKHPILSTEIQIVDKAVIEEEPLVTDERKDFRAGPSFKPFSYNFEEDEDDDWLNEDAELEGYNTAAIFVGNEDDVSFSDLEDDDFDCTMPIKSKIVTVDLGTPKKAL